MEWVNNDAKGFDEPTFSAWYVEGSWFVTGGRRKYKQSAGAISRPKIEENLSFGDDGTFGALQLAARFSGIDLTDGDIEGGEATSFTLGLNWYLNPNTRIMFNYVITDVDEPEGDEDGDGDVSTFQMRFQIDF
jgi:phosphate-selective porin OprO/OprP